MGIWIRNADPHLIYDINTKKRINNTKSIFIGDHVWLGQSVIILKGTQIASGSIVGAMGLVSETMIPSNECWGGVSAKRIRGGVFGMVHVSIVGQIQKLIRARNLRRTHIYLKQI